MVAPVRQEVKDTKQKLDETRKQGTYALAAVTGVLLVIAGAATYRDWQHGQEVQQLAADVATIDDQLTKRAENEIDQSEQDAALAAVYLVAQVQGDEGKATAWAFAPNMLATNAHVTSKIDGHESDYVLIGPHGERIPIKDVDTHPGYAQFKSYLDTVGGTIGGEFKQLDVINHEYDVGIIYTAEPLPTNPDTGDIATLELALEKDVEALKPGAAVAAVGFPIEEMIAQMVATHAPATLHFGNISSLTDIFMCRAEPDRRLLIQHSVPVTAGMSGSPLIDASGKVIGIVSGGNTTNVVEEVTVTEDKKPAGGEALGDQKTASGDSNTHGNKSKIEVDGIRIPSAAMVNFAQRIDVLEDLQGGVAAANQKVADDRNYWKDSAKKFVSVLANTKKNFVAFIEYQYKVTDPQRQEIGGTLRPSKAGAATVDLQSHGLVLEPGHIYGFVVGSTDGTLIAFNVKKQDASKQGKPEFLKAEDTELPAPASPLAPTTWVSVDKTTPVEVNVFGTIRKPAEYELYVYDWVKPAESPSADASATPQP